MDIKILFTGAVDTGKTRIWNELEYYLKVPEVSTQLMRQLHIKPTYDPELWQSIVDNVQLYNYKFKDGIFDRSLPDEYAFKQARGMDIDYELYRDISYDMIFYFQPWKRLFRPVHDIDWEMNLKIDYFIREWLDKTDHDYITIESETSVENRTKFIKKKMNPLWDALKFN